MKSGDRCSVSYKWSKLRTHCITLVHVCCSYSHFHQPKLIFSHVHVIAITKTQISYIGLCNMPLFLVVDLEVAVRFSQKSTNWPHQFHSFLSISKKKLKLWTCNNKKSHIVKSEKMIFFRTEFKNTFNRLGKPALVLVAWKLVKISSKEFQFD